jgi:hypothetical protein
LKNDAPDLSKESVGSTTPLTFTLALAQDKCATKARSLRGAVGCECRFTVDAAHFVLAPLRMNCLHYRWERLCASSLSERAILLPKCGHFGPIIGSNLSQTPIKGENIEQKWAERFLSDSLLVEKIANLYVGIPIPLFLDNARY